MGGRWKRREQDIYTDPTCVCAAPGVAVAGSAWSAVSLNMLNNFPVLKAASSVVALRSSIDKRELFDCSGVIVESKPASSNATGRFVNYIITSASLIADPVDDATVPSNIRVQVYLSGGEKCEGKVAASDFYYNIAVIEMMSDARLQVAVVRKLDTCIPIVSPCQEDLKPFCRPCDLHVDKQENLSQPFHLQPGDQVTALARSYYQSVLRIEGGKFSVESCMLNCQELLMTTCRTSKGFIGGPLVNCGGEVIGINFFHRGCTMFLPTNIVWRCYKSLTRHEHVHRPWHGIELTDLYTEEAAILEKIIQKFPDIHAGVIVEKVKEDSPAEQAGLLPMDVVAQCNGSAISGSLEFFEMMWDKSGQSVDLEIKRLNGNCLRLTLTVEEAKLDRYNQWPDDEFWRYPPFYLSEDDEDSDGSKQKFEQG